MRRSPWSTSTANCGRRITIPALTRAYNAQFPTERRSEQSISGHVEKVDALKAIKKSFDKLNA